MSAPADFYTGLVVEAYEALKSRTFDAARYSAFVREHGQPGLEVGCGAGQPLLQLAAEGLDVDGVDSSPDMLDRARAAAHQQGLDVGLHLAWMQDLDLGRRYRSIYLAGPTFELLPDDDAALQALQAFRRHLTPDGMIMIPLWIAGPTPADDLGTVREAVDASGTILRYAAVSEDHDPITRTRRTAVRYERVPRTGPSQRVDREWLVHWQTPQTIAALAAQAGLTVRDLDPSESHLTGAPDEEFTVLLGHA